MNSYDLFKKYIHYIEESNKFEAMVVKGRAGVGKSHLISKELPHAVIVNGHITPTKLFELIKLNCSVNSVIVFDDCDTLLRNKVSNAILKSVVCPTHEGKRIVQYDSKFIRNEEDRYCLFEGKVFFIGNDFQKNNDVEAIMSKSFVYNFNPTDEEVMNEILKTKNPNMEVLNFLVDNIRGKNQLDFRLYFKSTDIYNLCKYEWKEMIKPLLSSSKEDIIDKLLHSGKSVKEQVEDYIRTTGKCRASYFNAKSKKSKSLKV